MLDKNNGSLFSEPHSPNHFRYEVWLLIDKRDKRIGGGGGWWWWVIGATTQGTEVFPHVHNITVLVLPVPRQFPYLLWPRAKASPLVLVLCVSTGVVQIVLAFVWFVCPNLA